MVKVETRGTPLSLFAAVIEEVDDANTAAKLTAGEEGYTLAREIDGEAAGMKEEEDKYGRARRR